MAGTPKISQTASYLNSTLWFSSDTSNEKLLTVSRIVVILPPWKSGPPKIFADFCSEDSEDPPAPPPRNAEAGQKSQSEYMSEQSHCTLVRLFVSLDVGLFVYENLAAPVNCVSWRLAREREGAVGRVSGDG